MERWWLTGATSKVEVCGRRCLRAFAAARLANDDERTVVLEQVEDVRAVAVDREALALRGEGEVLHFVDHHIRLLVACPLNVPRALGPRLPHPGCLRANRTAYSPACSSPFGSLLESHPGLIALPPPPPAWAFDALALPLAAHPPPPEYPELQRRSPRHSRIRRSHVV